MEVFDKDRQGMVLRIERSSIHDGDGFRTVVFLKGCPLRCQWCSTPESQSMQVEEASGNVYGKQMTVEEVLREIRKDSLFFFISSGGVTLSGGELLAQPEFALAILKNCKREGLNTAVETSFFGQWDAISPMLPYINTAFVDLKLFDGAAHQAFCGADNNLILSNLLATNQAEGTFRLVVRVPIIPGVNDTAEELDGIGAFCTQLRRLAYVQLLPYHRLGMETYKKLGRTYALPQVNTPTDQEMERCRARVRAHGLEVR